jgi:hypothetical protein
MRAGASERAQAPNHRELLALEQWLKQIRGRLDQLASPPAVAAPNRYKSIH